MPAKTPSKIALEKTSLSNLKCSSCKKYLSLAPIYTHDNKNVCGRCPPAGSRNVLFEELAKEAVFPCIYPECEEALPWGTVLAHENQCWHRGMACPFPSCKEEFEVEKLEAHFDKCHKGFKYVDEMEIHAGVHDREVFLLMNEKLPYLVLIWKHQENKAGKTAEVRYAVGVFSAQHPKTNYNVTITFTDEANMATQLSHIDQEMQVLDVKNPYLDPVATTKFEYLLKPSNSMVTRLNLKINGAKKENCMVKRTLGEVMKCYECDKFLGSSIYTAQSGYAVCNVCKVYPAHQPVIRCYSLEDVVKVAKASNLLNNVENEAKIPSV